MPVRFVNSAGVEIEVDGDRMPTEQEVLGMFQSLEKKPATPAPATEPPTEAPQEPQSNSGGLTFPGGTPPRLGESLQAGEPVIPGGIPAMSPTISPEQEYNPLLQPLVEIPKIDASEGNKLTRGVMRAISPLQAPEKTAAALNAASGLISGTTSIAGTAALGAAPVVGAIGRAAIGLGFAIPAVKDIGQASTEAGRLSVEGTPQKAADAKAGLIVGNILTPALIAAGIRSDLRNSGAPLTAAAVESTIKPKESSASEISPAAKVYGDVRPLQEPAKVVPVEEGGARVQPQASGQEVATSSAEVPKVESAGPGAAASGEPGTGQSQIRQLADSFKNVTPEPGTNPIPLKETIREKLSGAFDTASKAYDAVLNRLKSVPVWTDWENAIGKWQAARQESTRDAYLAWKDTKEVFPDESRRAAIGAWVDAGGDRAVLERMATDPNLPERYRKTYEDALALNKDETVTAQNTQQYFERRLEDAKANGILEDGLENYIRRIYPKESPLRTALVSELQYLNTVTPGFARERLFQYDADAARAGLKPIQDFAARAVEYDQSLNHAIADRALVKQLMERKMPDGRPMIDTGGSGVALPEGSKAPEAVLIKPQYKPTDTANPKNNRGDYRPFSHPAFRKWKWVAKESGGGDILVQGDVLVHPDALPQIRKLLEPSVIRQNPIGRAALNVSSTIKQTMLDLSLFHPVQIGIHGLEHKVLPVGLKEINLKDATQRGLVEHGLVVAEDRGFYDWAEGLHGTSLTRHIPKVGPMLQDFHNWMFKEWIPTIKMNMALKALERNKSRYPNLSENQLLKLTGEQANAAFGGLNYRMLGRSQTMQDFLRLTLLAPDFLEARGRFAGQALKGYGKEQLSALMLGAATMYVTARIFNQMYSGDPHWEKENAFNIVVGKHSYGVRTVQGDIMHLIDKPGQFWYHRLNPTITRPAMEAVTGRDYFGRKIGLGDVLLNEIRSAIPISLRGLTEGKEQSLFESALNAMGVVTRRYSAITRAYTLADEWRSKNKVNEEPGEFIYDATKDPFRALKLSLQYEDSAQAAVEIGKALEKGGYTETKLVDHFRRYSSAPFTGSASNDRKFIESLNDSQKQEVEAAREQKKKVFNDFKSALELYRQSKPSEPIPEP